MMDGIGDMYGVPTRWKGLYFESSGIMIWHLEPVLWAG